MASDEPSAHTSPATLAEAEMCAASLDTPRTLFVGNGDTAVAWYRCAMPAMFLGADWCGLLGTPPKVLYKTGYVNGGTKLPDWSTYDVVVLQQPHGPGWLRVIRELRAKGVKVVYEIDDYAHGIRRVQGHDWQGDYSRKHLAEMEMCMRACHALIVSTEYLARRYQAFNARVFVCRNGLDLGRYRVTVPDRDMTIIGWSGATGHDDAVVPWMQVVCDVMAAHPLTAFVSIGHDYASPLMGMFGAHRALTIPFCLIDSYPAAMANMDIALAPAGRGAFFKAKSDLRWLEASALRIPVIADPLVYSEVKPGVTGLVAGDVEELRGHLELLVGSSSRRRELGDAAYDHLVQHRTMEHAAQAWRDALAAL